MIVSKKAIYAVKALTYLAAVKDKRSSTITEIAENENIPREYLAKILKELNHTGFIKSYKGILGGYRLAKPRGKISFWDILGAIQEPFNIPGKLIKGRGAGYYEGASFQFWYDLHQLMKHRLAKMTLDKIDYRKYYSPKTSARK